MKPRKMQSRVMWAVIPHSPEDGFQVHFTTRAAARRYHIACGGSGVGRVVRVRVTEAP